MADSRNFRQIESVNRNLRPQIHIVSHMGISFAKPFYITNVGPFLVKSNKTDEKVCVETEQLCNYIYPHITDNVVWCGAGSLYHCNLQFTFDQKSSWVAVSKNYRV